jgi:hypothetical protein
MRWIRVLPGCPFGLKLVPRFDHHPRRIPARSTLYGRIMCCIDRRAERVAPRAVGAVMPALESNLPDAVALEHNELGTQHASRSLRSPSLKRCKFMRVRPVRKALFNHALSHPPDKSVGTAMLHC